MPMQEHLKIVLEKLMHEYPGVPVSAVGQSVPPPVEMKGFKVYHLESGQKAAQ